MILLLLIMSTLQKTFFKVYGKSNNYCQLELTICEEIIHNQYYIMKLNLEYEDTSLPIINHPDDPFKPYNLNKQIFGELIFKNELTQMAVDYLMTDMTKLSKYTGRTNPISYKLSLIVFLSNLWD